LVYPSRLTSVAAVAVAMSVFLMLIARPVGVLLCLLPFRLQRNELAYISWVGMRGSVPIVLATFPISYGLPDADAIFNVIFFIVMTSVLIQGLTLVPCARWLGCPSQSPPCWINDRADHWLFGACRRTDLGGEGTLRFL
jgi:cell volume regulation protein A